MGIQPCNTYFSNSVFIPVHRERGAGPTGPAEGEWLRLQDKVTEGGAPEAGEREVQVVSSVQHSICNMTLIEFQGIY